MLIQNHTGLEPYLSRATGTIIATHIGDLITEKREAHLEAKDLLQAWVNLTRTQVIYVCLFRDNAATVGELKDFVASIQEEDQIPLDYVPQDTALRPRIPYFLACWVQIRFSKWLDMQWSDRYTPPPQFHNT